LYDGTFSTSGSADVIEGGVLVEEDGLTDDGLIDLPINTPKPTRAIDKHPNPNHDLLFAQLFPLPFTT